MVVTRTFSQIPQQSPPPALSDTLVGVKAGIDARWALSAVGQTTNPGVQIASIKNDGVTDDQPVIQAALNALPNTGGTVLIVPPTGSPGPCLIKNTINLGNGSTGFASTKSGMKLCGVGIPDARTFPGYIFSGIVLSWGGAAGGTMIAVKGPLGAWGIENISAECNISAAIGLLVTSGHDGSVVNFTTDQYTAAGIKTNCVEPFGALFNTDANHNYFLNIRTIGGAAGSDGIFLDGCPSGAANSDFNVFVNVFANQPSTGSAIHLKTCDSNTFIGCQFLTQGPPAPALLFDYTGPGGIFPVSNAFFACTVGNPAAPIAANLGSPGAPYGYYNRLFMTNANGEPFVNLPGLSNGFMATVTVANLPPVPFEGLELVISNSNTNTPGATVSGTGAFKVLAAYSGVSWRVVVDLS